MADTLPLTETLQMTWHRPKKASGCRRDPDAGPGTCFHWWEGCPDGAKRGCYFLWAEAHRKAGKVPEGPGKARPPVMIVVGEAP